MEQEVVRTAASRFRPYGYWLRFEELIKAHFGIPPIFIRFLIVGGIGYLVNQVALSLLYDTFVGGFLPAKETRGDLFFFVHDDIRLLIASIIAVELSIISNFAWHNLWTFRHHHKKPMVRRFLQFNTTSLGSPLISVAVLNILTPYFGVHHLIANTIGVLLGTSWNWFCNTRIIWRSHRPPAVDA